jgi:predicted nucleotidyltransferase
MDANEIERKLEEKKVHIKGVFHIREIGLFGSYIRGEQTARYLPFCQTLL